MSDIEIGLNGRFFPSNWRPALQEITFASANGFRSIQFQGKENGLSEVDLGASFSVVDEALRRTHVKPVMEIVIRVDTKGYTASGKAPLEILVANLPAIIQLQCQCVHWHLVPLQPMEPTVIATLEKLFLPQFAQGAILGKQHLFKFGFEHNEPDLLLFALPESCAFALNKVPNLYFVWDFNHTSPDHLSDFAAMIPFMSMVHVSDSPLPEINHHLPLGMGTINFAAYCNLLLDKGFNGPAILEIGGLPKSGGFGRDTDEALIDSLQKVSAAL